MSADTIINWAAHTGIAVSILVALVLIIRRPFSRIFGAQAAYLLWALPLIRLVLPEIPITIPRPSWASSIPSLPTEFVATPAYEAIITGPVAAPINWQLPLAIIWLSVAVLWLARQMFEQTKTIRLMKQSSSAASASIQANIDKAMDTLGLKRAPNVRSAASNIGPLVTGLLRPIVILPRNFETDFSGEQQLLALTHELAHIKRRDLWAAFGALVFRVLNWPNPLVHWAAAKFRADQEAACDAYVLKTMGGGARAKQSYAATLVHSAKLTQTPTGKALTPSPLCLTIHHPLKERLMTLKTPKNNANFLSRGAAAVFLTAALALTAPLTIAAAQDSAADTPQVQTKMKKVYKIVENNDGVETKKSYEITMENGVTTAYSIDEFGNKTLVDADEIEAMPGMSGDHGMRITMTDEDGGSIEKHMKILTVDHMGQSDGQGQLFIKRIVKGADGQEVEMDDDVYVMGLGGGSHASAMVSAAQDLLSSAEETTDGTAQKKIKKARKALKEALAALEAAE